MEMGEVVEMGIARIKRGKGSSLHPNSDLEPSDGFERAIEIL